MKKRTAAMVALEATDAEAVLERIKGFEGQLARAKVNSRRYRDLTASIRIEAHAYRKSLDTAQATALHDRHSPSIVAKRGLFVRR